jgi:hypothetical protein
MIVKAGFALFELLHYPCGMNQTCFYLEGADNELWSMTHCQLRGVGLPPLIFPFTIIIVYFCEKWHCNLVFCTFFDEIIGELGSNVAAYLMRYLRRYI